MAWHYRSALEAGKAIHQGEISSLEMTQWLLKRIVDLDDQLGAFTTVCEAQALAAATRADQELANGKRRSCLHGVPIGIKDIFDTRGIETAYGMKIYRHHRPKQDATVVNRLAEAGTVMLGKLKMTDGALGGHHPSITAPVNPWHQDYWCGVSSSGSGVSVAAGLCFAALGTDTGGSIRFPAAYNGVVGLKPSWGRVSRAGVFPLAYTLDHVGPLARTVADCGAILSLIAGADRADPTSSPKPVPDYQAVLAAKGERRWIIGIDDHFNSEDSDAGTLAAIAESKARLQACGAVIKAVKMPDWQALSEYWVKTAAIEARQAHQQSFPRYKHDYGPTLANFLSLGEKLHGVDYLKGELLRRTFQAAMEALFQQVDILLCPNVCSTERPKEGSESALHEGQNYIKFTAPFNYSGHPCLSLPVGLTSAGVPKSVQLIAKHFHESDLIEVGHQLEQALGYYQQHPPCYL